MVGCILERDTSIEPFGLATTVLLYLTRGPTTINKFAVTDLH